MYERIRKIPEELGIKSALPTPAPAPAPPQALSKSSINKRKHMELEPEIKIPGLDPSLKCQLCQQHGIAWRWYKIFFADEFGDQAFQRWSDIDKVRMEALVSYLVAASMVKSPEDARFTEETHFTGKTLASVRRTQLNEAEAKEDGDGQRLRPASSVMLRNINILEFDDATEMPKYHGKRGEKEDVGRKRTQGSISLLRGCPWS
ncbi:hypothetical protein Tco_0019436 [Tanacetum coccineum]